MTRADSHGDWWDQDNYRQLLALQNAIVAIRDNLPAHHLNALLRAFVVFANAMFEEELKTALCGRPSGKTQGGVRTGEHEDLHLHGRAVDWADACQTHEIPVGSPGAGAPSHEVWLSGLTYLRDAIVHRDAPSAEKCACIEAANLPINLEELPWNIVGDVKFRYAAIGPTLYWLAEAREASSG